MKFPNVHILSLVAFYACLLGLFLYGISDGPFTGYALNSCVEVEKHGYGKIVKIGVDDYSGGRYLVRVAATGELVVIFGDEMIPSDWMHCMDMGKEHE